MTEDTDTKEPYFELDETVRGRVHGLFEAARMVDIKADHHNDLIGRGKSDKHHTACRNTCTNMAATIRREAVNVCLSPNTSTYYYDDRKRSERNE